MNAIKTIFISTSREGVPALRELEKADKYLVEGVITQPDKPVGRSQKLCSTPIKKTALELDIPVYEPDNDADNYRQIIEETKPELIITISFGEMIPKYVIDYPKYKCLNIHYSLLPQLRGAVPVQMAILRGLEKTGVTIAIMEETLDTGPILSKKEIKISPDETTTSLKQKLIPAGTALLMQTLPKWIDGDLTPQPQDPEINDYCYEKDLSKEKAQIRWGEMTPEHIEKMVRAFVPWPVAWTFTPEGKRLKIFKAELVDMKHGKSPGTMIKKDCIPYFATTDPKRVLRLDLVQKEGKRQMKGKVFACGVKLDQ
jgi:methionyl-tRNA formyltransferase